MNALSIETRIIRPEVVDACYAYDGAYWRIERHRDGSSHRHLLDRPPAGALVYVSYDDFATWRTFTVPAGRPAPAVVLCILIAIAAIPVTVALLPGSAPQVAVLIGAAISALAALQARIEYRRHLDPATICRLAAGSALYLAATHRRHTHRRY